MAERSSPHLYSIGEGFTVEIGATSEADADLIMALIDSMSGTSGMDTSLMNIIMEGVNDFRAGRNSAQDTARIIQSRASILVAEQSG